MGACAKKPTRGCRQFSRPNTRCCRRWYAAATPPEAAAPTRVLLLRGILARLPSAASGACARSCGTGSGHRAAMRGALLHLPRVECMSHTYSVHSAHLQDFCASPRALHWLRQCCLAATRDLSLGRHLSEAAASAGTPPCTTISTAATVACSCSWLTAVP